MNDIITKISCRNRYSVEVRPAPIYRAMVLFLHTGKPIGVGAFMRASTESSVKNVNLTDYPVLEVAVLDVKRGQAEAFKTSFKAAEPIIAAAPGFGGLELRRCVENDHRFLLLVRWDTVASHGIGFRSSPGYQEWKNLLHHFYEPFPVVEHYVADP